MRLLHRLRLVSGAPVPNKPQLGTLGERINANTIAIVSGNPNATYMSIAYDMSAVLDDGDDFRILPIIGKVQNEANSLGMSCLGRSPPICP